MTPPRLADRLLSRLLPAEYRESIIADLHELYARGDRSRGWYWRQVFGAALARAQFDSGPATGERNRGGLAMALTDVRIGLRGVARHPARSVLVVMMMAIGIAANVAVRSILGQFVEPRLGVPDQEQLRVVQKVDAQGLALRWLSGDEWRVIEALSPDLVAAAASSTRTVAVRAGEVTRDETATLYLGDYWGVMGIRPRVGRLPRADAPEVLVSDAYQRTHGAPVGSPVTIDRQLFTIVGVAPPTFRGTERADLYLSADAWSRATANEPPVRHQATLRLAQAQEAVLGTRLAIAWPSSDGDPRVASVAEAYVSEAERSALSRALNVMGTLAALVLLAAWANATGLVAARLVERTGDIAIMASLGATRARIVSQLTGEMALIAIAVIAAASLASWSLMQWLPLLLPSSMAPSTFDLNAGELVLFSAVGVTLLLGAALPLALWAARPRGAHGLRPGSGGRRDAAYLRESLLVLQLAQAAMLAGVVVLMLRSAQMTERLPQGFDRRDTHVVSYRLPRDLYDAQRARMLNSDVLARLQSQPGIDAAALVSPLPLIGYQEIQTIGPRGDTIGVRSAAVSAGYFDAVGSALVRGRAFTAEDSTGVAILSADAAARLFPDGEALGATIRLRRGGVPDTSFHPAVVVGIVTAGTYGGRSEVPFAFTPHSRRALAVNLIVRSRAAPELVIPRVQSVLSAADPATSIESLGSLDDLLDRAWLLNRMVFLASWLFGGVALIIAGAGVFSFFTFDVASRRHEIGMRLVLGAGSGDVVSWILRRSMTRVAIGAAAGLPAMVAAGSVLRGYLFGVGPADPATLIATVVAVAATTALAVLLPARRASRIEPGEILRRG